MVIEISGNAIVKSTEILQEHYVDSQGEKRGAYVERYAHVSRGEGLLVLFYQSFFDRPGGDLGSGSVAQLGKDIANVWFYRACADDQCIGNLTTGLPARDSHRNLTFALSQSAIAPLGSAPGRRRRHEREQVMPPPSPRRAAKRSYSGLT